MKYFILCFFVLATLVVSIHSLQNEYQEVLRNILKECRQASKVTEKELKDMHGKNNVSNSPEMKKYLGCVAVGVGFVLDNGEVNKELLRWRLKTTNNKDKADEIVQACAIKKSSKEETGYNLLKCTIDEKGTKFSHPTE